MFKGMRQDNGTVEPGCGRGNITKYCKHHPRPHGYRLQGLQKNVQRQDMNRFALQAWKSLGVGTHARGTSINYIAKTDGLRLQNHSPHGRCGDKKDTLIRQRGSWHAQKSKWHMPHRLKKDTAKKADAKKQVMRPGQRAEPWHL